LARSDGGIEAIVELEDQVDGGPTVTLEPCLRSDPPQGVAGLHDVDRRGGRAGLAGHDCARRREADGERHPHGYPQLLKVEHTFVKLTEQLFGVKELEHMFDSGVVRC
jgi:hypothetical protein